MRHVVLGAPAARGPGPARPAGLHGVVAGRRGGAAAGRGHPRYGDALAERLARAGVHCAQIPGRIATTSFIRKAHKAGLHVHVWTLNRRPDMERALDLGADGIMTDETVMLRDLLIERGVWPS